jgi:N-acetylglucosaminyldiphosphoundecaprenol N-acetyl-beta-D-mannosaminyltransferase
MKRKYFNIYLEFDKVKINNAVLDAIREGKPAYVCAVDGNSLVKANENPSHLEALNGALINLSDSSWIPFWVNIIYHTNYENYTGSDIFYNWIKTGNYKHFFLGSKTEILEGLRKNLIKINPAFGNMRFETLPVRNVEDFDYHDIADMINTDNPDFIWVSLGAPKQEQFMSRLKPLIHRGVMLGVGAVFRFYSGNAAYRRAPRWMIRIKMEWLYRTFQEPQRMIKRYRHVFMSMPKLIINEIKRKRNCIK